MKNLFKKTLVFVLSAAMTLSFTMPAKKAQADTYDQVFDVYTVEDMDAAVATINGAASGNFKINVKADLELFNSDFSFDKNHTTIDGENHTIQTGPTGAAISAWNNGTEVTVSNAIFEGQKTSDNPGVFYAINDSCITMNSGVIIRNNEGNNYYGGAVSVANAKFVMNGGLIENCGIVGGSLCYGGGVGVFNGSIFIMNGGTIKDCYVKNPDYSTPFYRPATAGGGVFVSLFSAFVFNGGTIDGCSAVASGAVGGGVAVQAHLEDYYEYGSWANLSSSFEMNGGTISNCSATTIGGALYAGGQYIQPIPAGTVVQTVIPEGHTRGVYLTGGTIDGNSVTDSDNGYGGGGMAFFYVKPTVSISNVTISDNTAPLGGGILVFDSYTAATINGCTITGNESDYNGGGVCIYSVNNSSGTNLSNCTITDNTSGDLGAGVYYMDSSPLKISGANIIQDNTYDGKDNNLNIYSPSAPVRVVGSLAGSKIGLSDPTLWDDGLDDDDPTAVSTDYLTSGYKTNNPGVDPKTYFTSDHVTWEPDFSDVDSDEVRLVRKTNASDIAGGNIIIDGVISVTLWAKLDASSEAEREDYSMKFTSGSDTKTVAYDASKKTTYQGDDYYGFTYKVNTIQMADVITGELLQDGSETGVEKDYSVQTYGENMLEKSNDIVLKDMLTYLLNYGAFSQTYFDYNTSNLPNVNCDKSDDITNINIDSKYQYDIEDDSLAGIDVKKSLSLGIDKGINVIFKFYASSDVDMDEYKATLSSDANDPFFVQEDGKTTYTTENMPFTKFEGVDNKLYTINLMNVPASRFDDMLTLTVAKDGDPSSSKYQVKFSVFSYAYAVVNEEAEYTDTSQIKPAKMNDLKNLLKSMYVYNDKMEKYAKENPDMITRYKITDSQ